MSIATAHHARSKELEARHGGGNTIEPENGPSHQSPSRLKELPGPLSTNIEFLLSHIIVLDTVIPSWQRRHIPRASIDPRGAMSRRRCDHGSSAWVPMAAANLSL